MAGARIEDPAFAALSKVEEHDEKPSPSVESVPQEEGDDIHSGLIFPTDEERATLRRVADTLPWNAYRKPSSSPALPYSFGTFSHRLCRTRRKVLREFNCFMLT